MSVILFKKIFTLDICEIIFIIKLERKYLDDSLRRFTWKLFSSKGFFFKYVTFFSTIVRCHIHTDWNFVIFNEKLFEVLCQNDIKKQMNISNLILKVSREFEPNPGRQIIISYRCALLHLKMFVGCHIALINKKNLINLEL